METHAPGSPRQPYGQTKKAVPSRRSGYPAPTSRTSSSQAWELSCPTTPHFAIQDFARTAFGLAGDLVQNPSTNRPIRIPPRPLDLVGIDATKTASKQNSRGLVLQLSWQSTVSAFPGSGFPPATAGVAGPCQAIPDNLSAKPNLRRMVVSSLLELSALLGNGGFFLTTFEAQLWTKEFLE